MKRTTSTDSNCAVATESDLETTYTSPAAIYYNNNAVVGAELSDVIDAISSAVTMKTYDTMYTLNSFDIIATTVVGAELSIDVAVTMTMTSHASPSI